jgi:hypothetical protein
MHEGTQEKQTVTLHVREENVTTNGEDMGPKFEPRMVTLPGRGPPAVLASKVPRVGNMASPACKAHATGPSNVSLAQRKVLASGRSTNNAGTHQRRDGRRSVRERRSSLPANCCSLPTNGKGQRTRDTRTAGRGGQYRCHITRNKGEGEGAHACTAALAVRSKVGSCMKQPYGEGGGRAYCAGGERVAGRPRGGPSIVHSTSETTSEVACTLKL